MADYIRIDVASEIKKLVPVLGKENALKIEQAYLLGDEEMKKRVIEMLDSVKAAAYADESLKNAVLLEAPSRETASCGDIFAGTVLYGQKRLYPFLLDRNMFLTHLGIFGSSGYGKTNVVHNLVRELSEKSVPVLIFDFSKRNYRDLINIPELKERVQIFTIGRNASPFKFNPLYPPEGVEISQWIKEFAEIFDHAYWLLGGGRHIILKVLDKVYKNPKPFDYPQLRAIKYVLDELESDKNSARERNWIVTAQRPLESLCFRETGQIFDTNKGILPSTFFEGQKITILELDSLTTNDKTFFIEIMLQWIRDWLIVKNAKEKLSGVIVLEEAHHVLNREKSKKMGAESVIDLVFREVRELGMGIIYVDQHPSLISYPALGNTSTHIYMNLGLDTQYSSDIQDACSMLGLDYRSEGKYLRQLPVGDGFLLCRRLSFPHPFLIQFPLAKIDKGSVTDDIVKSIAPKLPDDEITVPAVHGLHRKKEISETHETPAVHIQEVAQEAPVPPQIPLPPPEIERQQSNNIIKHNLPESCLKILRVLGRFDASATSEIYKGISMSGSTFKQNADRLVSEGLLGARTAKVYRQTSIFYFLTNKGAALFSGTFSMLHEDINAEEFYNAAERLFKGEGWAVDRSKSIWTLLRKDKQVNVILVSGLERAQLSGQVANESAYFVAATEHIKNAIIQMAAKRVSETGKPFILSVSSFEALHKGEKFRKLAFE
ncbi:DNA double-strand break repair helicase HerA [uncultured archaeon]|nr:DNA double-strand break repair helicase HerA [uncultured archaeon]